MEENNVEKELEDSPIVTGKRRYKTSDIVFWTLLPLCMLGIIIGSYFIGPEGMGFVYMIGGVSVACTVLVVSLIIRRKISAYTMFALKCVAIVLIFLDVVLISATTHDKGIIKGAMICCLLVPAVYLIFGIYIRRLIMVKVVYPVAIEASLDCNDDEVYEGRTWYTPIFTYVYKHKAYTVVGTSKVYTIANEKRVIHINDKNPGKAYLPYSIPVYVLFNLCGALLVLCAYFLYIG